MDCGMLLALGSIFNISLEKNEQCLDLNPCHCLAGRGVVQEVEHGLWYAACTGFNFQYFPGKK